MSFIEVELQIRWKSYTRWIYYFYFLNIEEGTTPTYETCYKLSNFKMLLLTQTGSIKGDISSGLRKRNRQIW